MGKRRLLSTVLLILVVGLSCALETNVVPAKNEDVHVLADTTTFRVLTFNTYNMGKSITDGLQKIAKWIKIINPDVAALQEVRSEQEISTVQKYLGAPWRYVYRGDCAVVSRHQIIENTTVAFYAGVGVKILYRGVTPIHAVSLHLDYTSYGPYAANNKLVTHKEQIDAGEYTPTYNCRYQNIINLLQNANFKSWLKSSSQKPLIIAGDFNTPSHLDWTEETKHLHGGWVYRWPATYTLQSQTDVIDSFRELHPDPLAEPGTTWSTINKVNTWQWNYTIPEPQDRIDYIFYKSKQIKAVRSTVFAGPFIVYPGHWELSDWPSDHYSVITEFKGL